MLSFISWKILVADTGCIFKLYSKYDNGLQHISRPYVSVETYRTSWLKSLSSSSDWWLSKCCSISHIRYRQKTYKYRIIFLNGWNFCRVIIIRIIINFLRRLIHLFASYKTSAVTCVVAWRFGSFSGRLMRRMYRGSVYAVCDLTKRSIDRMTIPKHTVLFYS